MIFDCLSDEAKQRVADLAERLRLPKEVVVAKVAELALTSDATLVDSNQLVAVDSRGFFAYSKNKRPSPKLCSGGFTEPDQAPKPPKTKTAGKKPKKQKGYSKPSDVPTKAELEARKAKEAEQDDVDDILEDGGDSEESATDEATPSEVEQFNWDKNVKGLGQKKIDELLPILAKADITTLEEAYAFEGYGAVDGVGEGTIKNIQAALAEALGVQQDRGDVEQGSEDPDVDTTNKVDDILDEAEEEATPTMLDEMREIECTRDGVVEGVKLFMRAADVTRNDLVKEMIREVGFDPEDDTTYGVALDWMAGNLPIQESQIGAILAAGEKLGEERESIERTRPEALFAKPLRDLTVAEADHYLDELQEEQGGDEVSDLNEEIGEDFFAVDE